MKIRSSEQIQTLHHVLAQDWIKDYSLAVDGGANVGDWSKAMAERFQRVLAFEPVLDTFVLLRARRLPANVELHREALLDRHTPVSAQINKYKSSHRSWYMQPIDGESLLQAIPLDSLSLPALGLLKLDLEGAEHLALIGAKATVKAFHPLLILEFDPKHSLRYHTSVSDTIRLLTYWGYVRVYESRPDTVWVWKG